MKKVQKAQSSLNNSEQLHHFLNALKICNKRVNYDAFEEIVCYGIGNFSKSHAALYQLALLLQLKYHLKVPLHIYDPLFNTIEKEILEKLNLIIIDRNEEGKRKIYNNTVFFLPHCPLELFNNLLWINWGLSLSKCVIIGNRHSSVITNTPSSSLIDFYYVTRITPAVEEIDIPNVFKFNDIFNDFAAHIFPLDKLNKVPADFWNFQEIPVYNKLNLEFIGLS
ncbi:hypothetical protein O3M35_000726 [Rhynocoris fuscipes]|uniref:SRR1-like domain-containing protein n=1 Tax=Rhynocoris fuscipes TaxID=488301 RepID=A0AAW1DPZ0_9HEMI